MINSLNEDLLGEILARVDGPALASAACVSTSLRLAAGERRLWQDLCHSTWPSTREETAAAIIASIPGGFAKFHAMCLPLLVYTPTPDHFPCGQKEARAADPSDLVSMIDMFCDGRSVFSKVLHGIAMHDCGSWFSEYCTFKLEALGRDDETGQPTYAFEARGEEVGDKLRERLEKDMRLSWAMLDKKTGRAVNLSSWKPRLVKTYLRPQGDVLMRFGCVIPPEKCSAAWLNDEGCELKCVITVRCRRFKNEAEEGFMRLVEIYMKMHVESIDIDGEAETERRGLEVLARAMSCRMRSRDHWAVEESYRAYERQREELVERWTRQERFDTMWAYRRVALLAFFFLCALVRGII